MSAPITVDAAQELLDSLYLSGDLSHDQAEGFYAILELARRLQQSHHDAWKLIGRCDMAFELISVAGTRAEIKQRARQMRAEIKKASER